MAFFRPTPPCFTIPSKEAAWALYGVAPEPGSGGVLFSSNPEVGSGGWTGDRYAPIYRSGTWRDLCSSGGLRVSTTSSCRLPRGAAALVGNCLAARLG